MDISLTELIKMIPEFLIDLFNMFCIVLMGATGLLIVLTALGIAITIPVILWFKCLNKISDWLDAKVCNKDKIDVSEHLSPITLFNRIKEYEVEKKKEEESD